MSQQNSLKPLIAICGNNQAEAVALVLKVLPGVCDRFDVQFLGSHAEAELRTGTLSRCAVFFEQDSVGYRRLGGLSKSCRRVRFPLLEFNLLWPFNCINPYNRPESPRFPFGRFPNGNSFIIGCIERGLSTEEILALDLSGEWHASWPNLNALFMSESARLSLQDSRCTVALGSYILKHFRKQRLFTAVQNPTNVLLSALILRLLHAALGSDCNISSSDVDMTLKNFGTRDLFGALSVPIHPKVAEHFDLVWYSPHDTYNIFDVQALTYERYVQQMVESARKHVARSA